MKNTITALFALLALFCQAQAPMRQLFDDKTIGEIRLTFAAPKWWESLDSMRIYGDQLLEGSAKVDGTDYSTVGVRFRGNSSYQFGFKRNPFNIKLNYKNPDQKHQGYKSIKLSSALRDPSMAREMLFLDIARKYMPASKSAYTRLYVNNEYIGLFIIIESIDSNFLKEHYGSSDGALFKAGVDYPEKGADKTGCLENTHSSLEYETDPKCLKYRFELESEGDQWASLHQLTNALKNDPKNIGSLLDIDETLWMLALNNVMVNLSSYTGKNSENYYLYQDQHKLFHPVFWDLNLAFGSFKNIGSGSDLELKDLQRLDPLLHSTNEYKPLISKLLSDPFNRKVYLAHMRQILEDHFYNGAYERKAKELQGLIVVPYSEDPNKPYPLDQFQSSLTTTIGRKTKIPGIVELMSKRTKLLKNHPELSSLPSIISDLQVTKRDKFENTFISSFKLKLKADRYPKRAVLYYRFNDSDIFSTLNCTDGQPVANSGSGVRSFECTVDAPTENAVMEYFIMVENSGTVSFSPANYSVKKYKVSIAEINK